MSNAIRRGDVSAFQRWEMASFGDNRPAQLEELKAAEAALEAKYRTEAGIEAEKARESARQEGFAAGYKEAYERGLKDGQETAYAETMVQVEADISALKRMAQEFTDQLHSASEQMSNDLMLLAVDLASHMLKARLELDPMAILPIVEDAITQLATVQQPAKLIVNPADAETIKNHLGETLAEDGWRVIADPLVERGGCKMETLHNRIDASYSTRWKKLLDAMQVSPDYPG
ncbi:flagellar assembly protein FliH [Undibacterium sp. TS12]|uniref:flagellar assembly protein FliH n=1 Tax=Undibacterium sp. TS12 TaxID=2908202 RepID=UPI001F4CD57B|nr:flagellar assembly protein FliH [Undibacterium sp. TS12]MCH8618806.1 flagellar assembly protein FliH [Undibacterium sp. TS12]